VSPNFTFRAISPLFGNNCVDVTTEITHSRWYYYWLLYATVCLVLLWSVSRGSNNKLNTSLSITGHNLRQVSPMFIKISHTHTHIYKYIYIWREGGQVRAEGQIWSSDRKAIFCVKCTKCSVLEPTSVKSITKYIVFISFLLLMSERRFSILWTSSAAFHYSEFPNTDISNSTVSSDSYFRQLNMTVIPTTHYNISSVLP